MPTDMSVRILVIEDDLDVRDSLVQLLSEENFVVDAVSNGPEGLYRALEWDYDVIVLDVMLPRLDGWGVLTKLRQRKATPVLMLTALGEIDERIKGLNEGADDYLIKPYNERELLARVRALLRRAKGLTEDKINLGRVIVDMSEQCVYQDGETVPLTASQYKIVAYLARNAGAVVSRGDLSEIVSGENEDTMSNVIDVQVHHIRRRLGKDFLQNRRGLGYIIPKP